MTDENDKTNMTVGFLVRLVGGALADTIKYMEVNNLDLATGFPYALKALGSSLILIGGKADGPRLKEYVEVFLDTDKALSMRDDLTELEFSVDNLVYAVHSAPRIASKVVARLSDKYPAFAPYTGLVYALFMAFTLEMVQLLLEGSQEEMQPREIFPAMMLFDEILMDTTKMVAGLVMDDEGLAKAQALAVRMATEEAATEEE